MIVHSHPRGRGGLPSERDLTYFGARPWGRIFGIWSIANDFLFVWQILGRSGDSFAYAAIPVVAEA